MIIVLCDYHLNYSIGFMQPAPSPSSSPVGKRFERGKAIKKFGAKPEEGESGRKTPSPPGTPPMTSLVSVQLFLNVMLRKTFNISMENLTARQATNHGISIKQLCLLNCS